MSSPASPGYLVGVAVLVQDERGRVLLGLREKELLWASFGGRLEAWESAHAGAIREVEEEVGLKLEHLTPLTFGEGIKSDGTHYATLYFSARLPVGQTPVIREPHLFAEMGWFALDALPANMWERERRVFAQLAQRSAR